MSIFQESSLSALAASHLLEYHFEKPSSPTIIAIGGIHGNEPAGVMALESLIKDLTTNGIDLLGNFFAIVGNGPALKNNVRYIDMDLNRVWTPEHIIHLYSQDPTVEHKEQLGLYELISSIINAVTGPVFILDLHTTSASSIPFITISDSLNNRSFAAQFKLPVILGIEEQLEGPLLSYLNEYGYVALGYEAGQHQEVSSITNCYHFVLQALYFAKCITKKDYSKVAATRSKPKKTMTKFYHISDRYSIGEDEHFVMKKGFVNFQPFKKGEVLASSNDTPVLAKTNATIFMPLYQQQGDDGFFVIRRLSYFWLALSKGLRKLNAYSILQWLPGVQRVHTYTVAVNPEVAKFATTRIFHLFGYRSKKQQGKLWYFTRRDRKKTKLPDVSSKLFV